LQRSGFSSACLPRALRHCARSRDRPAAQLSGGESRDSPNWLTSDMSSPKPAPVNNRAEYRSSQKTLRKRSVFQRLAHLRGTVIRRRRRVA
jgi:hypothetical protein